MTLEGKKILILQLLYIGDTIAIIPLVENLKNSVPFLAVDIMVNQGTESLLAHHPDIRKVWTYDRKSAKRNILSELRYSANLIKRLRSEKYDVVISLTVGDRASFLSFATGAPLRLTHYSPSRLSRFLMNQFVHLEGDKPLHFVDYNLELLRFWGISNYHKNFRIHIPQTVAADIDRQLAAAGINKAPLMVAIHPGARKKMRQWPPERFARIARLLRERYQAAIILVGGPDEEGIVDKMEENMGFQPAFRSTGLSLLELAALFARCHLFLGNDSAPGHIAAAVNCPTLTLFGPNFPQLCQPIGPRAAVIFKNLPCCGCRHEEEFCLHPQDTCMQQIEVDEVWEKIEALLTT